jgi:hypothetical protein
MRDNMQTRKDYLDHHREPAVCEPAVDEVVPSPEEISRRAAEVRRRWSDVERFKRGDKAWQAVEILKVQIGRSKPQLPSS